MKIKCWIIYLDILSAHKVDSVFYLQVKILKLVQQVLM